jgi:mono/diheme cytochrome c family protein/plastocyanin
VSLFVIGYYFYELGLPAGLSQSRLTSEEEHQYVTSVERGYNIYEANCARCHGPNGKGPLEPNQPPGAGYIGPTLNDQEKLFVHLNENYLHNVLQVGGRYVCGNPKSQMPVWSDTGNPPGPLNYKQIQDLIAFLRAPSNQEFEIRDPSTNEPTGKSFTGWRDPNYKPAPGSTPYPDCYLDALKGGGGSGSPAPSADANAPTVSVSAQNFAFDPKTLEAPADKAFNIAFDNKDAGVPHDVDIKKADGTKVADNPIDSGTQATYPIPALPAGEYTFFCSVHPQMTGTLTVK